MKRIQYRYAMAIDDHMQGNHFCSNWMMIPGNTALLHVVCDMTIQSAGNIHARNGIHHIAISRGCLYVFLYQLLEIEVCQVIV